jgi:hypothetical protein
MAAIRPTCDCPSGQERLDVRVLVERIFSVETLVLAEPQRRHPAG